MPWPTTTVIIIPVGLSFSHVSIYCTYRQLSISTATLYISAIIYHEISACARVRISSAAFSRAWVTFRFLELNEIRFSACYRFVARPVLLHLLLPPLVRRTFPRFEDPPTYSAPFLDVRGAVFSVMTSSGELSVDSTMGQSSRRRWSELGI